MRSRTFGYWAVIVFLGALAGAGCASHQPMVHACAGPPPPNTIVARLVCETPNANEFSWTTFVISGTDARSRDLCAKTFARLECAKEERATRLPCSDEAVAAPEVPIGTTILRQVIDLHEWADLKEEADQKIGGQVTHYRLFAGPGACAANRESRVNRANAPSGFAASFTCFPSGSAEPPISR